MSANLTDSLTDLTQTEVEIPSTTDERSSATGHGQPDWFRRKEERKQSPKTNTKLIKPVAEFEIVEPPQPWYRRLKRWLVAAFLFQTFASTGYVVSTLFHTVALTVLAFMMLNPDIVGDQGIGIIASQNESVVQEFEKIDTTFDMSAAGSPNTALAMQMEFATVTDSELKKPAVPVDASPQLAAKLGNNGKGKGGSGAGYNPGNNAVTKGSFTAWTIPEDPKPGESYKVVIRIKLPDRIKRRYPVKDISGMLVGTDKYRQAIPGPTTIRYLIVKNHHVQFDVTVPGAARLVRDKIEIQSRILNEKQIIEIEF